ncbi:MAG: UvrD-helicase domain-containing protein [Gemmatimonadales bacterium]
MRLNAAQRAAAHDAEHHVLVDAGAGTGKTQCVIGRLLYVMGEDIAGQRIDDSGRLDLRDVAAITFTNVAAADLQRKLRNALRHAGRIDEAHRVDTARIGTIHAFCARIIREFALQLDRSPGLAALDEAEGITLAVDSAREAMLHAIEGGDIPVLPALLAERSVEDVQGWVARLALDADRLAHLSRDSGASEHEQCILELARRALASMRHRLNERAALDFDSMIGLTRDLIRDHADIRRVLQRRIRLLIIDEFQDVDPAQQEIAWLLGEPGSGRRDTTRLMLVGDPKQSIFRFRRADVAVWTRVRRELETGHGVVHTLTENFRSRRPILGFVDAVLGPELGTPVDPMAGVSDFEVLHQPLIATPQNDVTDSCVELLVLPPAENGKARTGEAARAVELPAVAARVAELVASGTAPGDIAILLSAWGVAERYRTALATHGIASWTLRNEGYWERREVLDCLVALQAMLDPLDDIALLGFLRSPMVAVRDETLLDIGRQVRTPYWRHLDQVASAEQELLDFGRSIVARFAVLRDRIPHDELLEELLAVTGYSGYLRLLGEDGRQPEANVQKLVRKMRSWRHLTLREVLQNIAETRERDRWSQEGDAPLASRADAVTITSIHGAKGLEWPVVIWADVARKVALPDHTFLVGRDAIRLRSPSAEKPEDDPRFAMIRQAEQLEGWAERKRLWYVAATRPRDLLIVAGVPLGEVGSSLDGTAAECFRRLGGLTVTGVEYRDHLGETFRATVRVAEPAPTSEEVVVAGSVLPATELGVRPAPIVVPMGRVRHSASELLTFKRCQRKHWFSYVAGIREPRINRKSPEFIDAVARGHIVHDVLEHLRELDELDDLLEDAIGRWDPDAPPPEGVAGGRYRHDLRGELERVATHSEYRAVADLPGAKRELVFVWLMGEGRELQGRIDLAAPRVDGVVLLDVKTGAVANLNAARRLAEAYTPQRDAYVVAMEAITGGGASDFIFHFSRAEVHWVEPVIEDVRSGAIDNLKVILGGIEEGGREMTAAPAECRFCGFKAMRWCNGHP